MLQIIYVCCGIAQLPEAGRARALWKIYNREYLPRPHTIPPAPRFTASRRLAKSCESWKRLQFSAGGFLAVFPPPPTLRKL